MKAGWCGDDYRVDIRIRNDLFGLGHRDGTIESLRKQLRCAGVPAFDQKEALNVASSFDDIRQCPHTLASKGINNEQNQNARE
ncbi:hypothetical protein [Caballeronia sordidicola]|jgi:hypothetical protein|uniref:Uncharacterized protein n=1 Tax=Caballeronia sordidicola TaxID=196367 RepID=A0A226X8E8_CABSO|nr:hypothetical protein [Caballeronia sordidicola]OXC79250.1 hypothetical protein BSU04_08750 [Caballeronia sordidicola]